MYRIYIVEDEQGIADAIVQQAELWQMEARAVKDFLHILDEFAEFQPHLVLMDISLPAYDGYYWCRELRRLSSVPIIFLSSAADRMNIIMAMNMGADDFISKPFDMRVLLAKIQALLRRTYDFCISAPILTHRGACLNTGDGTLTYGDARLELSKNEYKVMLLLFQNRGKVVSREKLMEALWETDCFVDENTLSVNVNRLRKKLDAIGLMDFITTKFGVGYYLGD